MHPRVLEVTERLIARSRATREAYLALIRGAAGDGPQRGKLQCANFAHGVAGCGTEDKNSLRMMNAANVAIVSSYNDMLSAHQPYEHFPEQIKKALREIGSVGQFAGGTPAMCDGVTQGEPGMELSLLSREVIALSTAVALSHNMFDAALMLGICDKIVPGLLMGALRFGHLPTIFVPGGPMPSGISNKEKADVRQRYAEGKASREELLESEMKSYHSPGTCTFYGTANTNQLLMEVMGLHLPGASFVNPYTPLRDALTREAAHQVTRLTKQNGDFMPLGEIVDERSLVNSIVALHATGGSTNHTLHMPAIAMSAGIQLTWQDMADLSEVVPTLSHVYPNGKADINHFQAAGGMAFLIRELLEAGLLHENVNTVAGHGLSRYTREPFLVDGNLVWRDGPIESLDESILRPVARAFSAEGGLRVMEGNLGRGVMKVSPGSRRAPVWCPWPIMAACCGVPTGRVDMLAFGLGSGIAGLGGVALSQIGNVGPDLGQGYIIDSFLVVVLGGVGQLAGTVYAAFGLGIANKILEPQIGAVLGKILDRKSTRLNSSHYQQSRMPSSA